jgi:hypothetical protein
LTELSDPPLMLAELLSRLARESADLARMTMRAEAALHGVLDEISAVPPEAGMDLQRIDLVRQSLEDISRLLCATAELVPLESRFSTAAVRRSVRLTGLAARLTGAHYVAAGTADPAVPDTDEDEFGLELF